MLRTWGCQLLAPTPGVRPNTQAISPGRRGASAGLVAILAGGLWRGRHDASRPWLGRHDVSSLWLGRHVVRLWGLMVRCCGSHFAIVLWCVRHYMSECGVVFLLCNTHSKRRASTQQSIVHKILQTTMKLPFR